MESLKNILFDLGNYNCWLREMIHFLIKPNKWCAIPVFLVVLMIMRERYCHLLCRMCAWGILRRRKLYAFSFSEFHLGLCRFSLTITQVACRSSGLSRNPFYILGNFPKWKVLSCVRVSSRHECAIVDYPNCKLTV